MIGHIFFVFSDGLLEFQQKKHHLAGIQDRPFVRRRFSKCEVLLSFRSVISGSLVGLLVIFRDVSFALVYCSPVGLQSSKTLMMVILGKKQLVVNGVAMILENL